VVCNCAQLGYGASTTEVSGVPTQSSEAATNEPKPKDWWDKASVVSQFFAGVVLAIVGLLITYAIQRSQIRASRETARAQLESAEVRAKEDRRLQEGQLTSQLVQHLTSESEAVREIAIVALRESVPIAMYDAVVAVLARADESARVRKTAIQQLGRSASAGVAQTLGEIATDPGRPVAERNLASSSASQISLSANMSPGTVVFTATNAFGVPVESSQLGGGVFTHFLVRGLSGDADLDGDGTVTAEELGHYVLGHVDSYAESEGRARQSPQFWRQTTDEIPIVGAAAQYSEITGVIVGVSAFDGPDLAPLAYAARDAERVHALFTSGRIPSTRLQLLTDRVTRSSILEELERAASSALKDSLFVLYYSGHGLLLSEGGLALAASDSDLRSDHSLVAFSSIRSLMERSKATAKAVFLDCSYSASFTTVMR
jgi:hypothetical protein